METTKSPSETQTDTATTAITSEIESEPLPESLSNDSDANSNMPDRSKFYALNYENVFPWLQFSNCINGFLFKYCELFNL